MKHEEADWYVQDVVMAACSAPGIFDSYDIDVFGAKEEETLKQNQFEYAENSEDEEDHYDFIDGGVAYNNPTLHMIYKEIQNDVELHDIFVLSLGTGKLAFQSNLADQHLFWNEKRHGHCITRMTEETHEEIDELLVQSSYLRMQPFFESPVGFAETEPDKLNYIFEKAFQVIKENQDVFSKMVKYFKKEAKYGDEIFE